MQEYAIDATPVERERVVPVKSQTTERRGRTMDVKGINCQEGNIPLLHFFLNMLQIALRAQTVVYQFPDNKTSS